jgi:hypothetical protein
VAFGDDVSSGPELRVCCGPRCGAEPGHRLIYAALEAATRRRGLTVRPVLCQGHCHGGVTVLLPGDDPRADAPRKFRDPAEARALADHLPGI